jgi:thiol-disulfide isomerase/thioredoxin
MHPSTLLATSIAACAVVAAVAAMVDRSSPQVATAAMAAVAGSVAGANASDARSPALLAGATGWLNSPPLALEGLRGKVVLVDFWTFTCINWRRELPYVRAWAEKYRAQGLVVIGVHTPEFEFERDEGKVRRAARDIGVDYPVAIDSNREVWRAFGNRYWPALYFIDAGGAIRHRHFGEGDYAESERMLQRLLSEAGAAVGTDLVEPAAVGIEAAPDLKNLRTPENYLGHGRTDGFDSPGGIVEDEPKAYTAPARLRPDHWALAGEWTVKEHESVLGRGPGRIAYRFHARDLHLVMGPSSPGARVRFRVLVDGRPPGRSAGVDVDALGAGVATEQRLYQLIRQPGPIGDRRFEIEFLDPGIEAFSVSFG